MTDRTRVSVVIPVHNADAYLARTKRQLDALDPVIDYEFVLIDDHSTDGSWDTLRRWVGNLPGEVVLLRADDRGVAQARNQALRSCTGEYVWLADADDEWARTIVSDMVAVADDTIDVVVCNAVKRWVDGSEAGRISDAPQAELSDGREAFSRLLSGTLQGHLWNKLFRLTALPDDPFPVTRAHSDLGGMLHILPRITGVAYLPRDLYTYFQNPGSILNGRIYEAENLATCYSIALSEANRLNMASQTELLTFKYRNVVIPITNELLRREQTTRADVMQEAMARARNNIRWGELFRLVRSRQLPRRAIAQAAIIKGSPALYRSLYRRTLPA